MIDPLGIVTVTVAARGLKMATNAMRAIELELPEDDSVAWAEFTLWAPHSGPVEVLLVVRQTADFPLAVLRLMAEATERREEVAPNFSNAVVTRPDPVLLALPSVCIDEDFVDGESALSIRASVGSYSAEGTKKIPDKRKYVANLYRRIKGIRESLNAIRDTTARSEEALRMMTTLGCAVATDILPADVLALLWHNRDALDGLVIQTTGEFDLPWELVHLVPPDGESGDGAVRFLSRSGVTRWVYGTPHPTVLGVARGRARVVCPEYRLRHLQLTATIAEREMLEKGEMQATAIHPEDAASLGALIREGFDLLHFAGHGRWTSAAPSRQELLLADYDDGTPARDWCYSDDNLRADLPDLGLVAEETQGPFVFLNACDLGRTPSGERSLGGFPEAFLRGGIAAFVGCSWMVGDDPAEGFVRAFYSALLENRTVGEAAKVARAAAAESADLSDIAFVVFAHPKARLLVT